MFLLSLPSVGVHRGLLGIPVVLNYKYILLGSLCYDAIKLLIDLFDLLVFVI